MPYIPTEVKERAGSAAASSTQGEEPGEYSAEHSLRAVLNLYPGLLVGPWGKSPANALLLLFPNCKTRGMHLPLTLSSHWEALCSMGSCFAGAFPQHPAHRRSELS